MNIKALVNMSLLVTVVAGILVFAASVNVSAQEAGEEDRTIYAVVVNHEEQYSIWPADREVPLGWKAVGFKGTKQACLDYIEKVWTDMRPLSLRKKMQEEAARAAGAPDPKPAESAKPADESLEAAAVVALVGRLWNELPKLVADEDSLSAIAKRWIAREDLTGKTEKQILELLFEDVKAVVADKETQDKIWSAWTGTEKTADKTPA